MYSFLPGANKKFWIIAIHTAVWIVYISFLFIANKLSDPTVTISRAVLFMLPFCLLFYISVFWLNRYRKMGPLLSVISFIGTFVVLCLLAYTYMYKALPSANIKLYTSSEIREFLKYAVLGYIQYYSYALLYFVVNGLFNKERALRDLQEEKYKRELENARLKEKELKAQKEKLQIEYAFLRTQVNPHFLHNTLNTLYSHAQEYSETLASNISKLSNMMRYCFDNISEEMDLVPLEKELKNLRRLIEINEIRYEGSEAVDFQMEGEIDNQMLPPLSLITIVENAFKYGDFTNPSHPLVIRLNLRPKYIYFSCRNKIQLKSLNDTSHSVGITNLQKRLDVLFKDRHSIIFNNKNGFYLTELTINN
ncbi:MAG: sensor histidine kinase [Chitinophagaceae bacterium]